MKKIIVGIFISFLLILTTGCKKSYSCSCLVDYQYEAWSSGEPYKTSRSYQSVESINEKTTKKQASDICIETQNSIYSSLVNTWSIYPKQFTRALDVHVSCKVK